MQAELNAAHKESELVRNRLHKLEEDLHIIKERNTELTEELQNRTGDTYHVLVSMVQGLGKYSV